MGEIKNLAAVFTNLRNEIMGYGDSVLSVSPNVMADLK